MSAFTDIGRELGELVEKKNKAYGNATEVAADILARLYPNGAQPTQYEAFNYTTLVLHKLSRLATDPGAFGENPIQDIAGYSVLMLARARETCRNLDAPMKSNTSALEQEWVNEAYNKAQEEAKKARAAKDARIDAAVDELCAHASNQDGKMPWFGDWGENAGPDTGRGKVQGPAEATGKPPLGPNPFVCGECQEGMENKHVPHTYRTIWAKVRCWPCFFKKFGRSGATNTWKESANARELAALDKSPDKAPCPTQAPAQEPTSVEVPCSVGDRIINSLVTGKVLDKYTGYWLNEGNNSYYVVTGVR